MDPRSRSEKQFCAAQYGCWEQRSGTQEDQSVFLAAELSLQPAPLFLVFLSPSQYLSPSPTLFPASFYRVPDRLPDADEVTGGTMTKPFHQGQAFLLKLTGQRTTNEEGLGTIAECPCLSHRQ